MTDPNSTFRKWFIPFLFISALLVFLIYQYNSQIWIRIIKIYDVLHDRYQLKALITSFGPYSPLAYITIQLLQVLVAPIPGGAIEFLGGYIFGVRMGFFYSMVGLILGSLGAFGIARIFEKVAVEKFVSPKTMKKFSYLIGHEGVILSFILFLVPGFPKDALCYILGLTPMNPWIFLLISTVGRIPGTLMACLQGGKAFEHQYRTFLVLLGISALVLLIVYIYHEEIHQLIKRLRSR